MLSASDASAVEDSGPTALDLPAGEQAFILRNGGGSFLQYLPDRAVENLLVVSAGPQPAEIEAAIRRRSLSPRSVGVVPISGFDLGYEGSLWTAERVSANDLTGVWSVQAGVVAEQEIARYRGLCSSVHEMD